jgi:tetratricopeptide (TPR) repeat protein
MMGCRRSRSCRSKASRRTCPLLLVGLAAVLAGSALCSEPARSSTPRDSIRVEGTIRDSGGPPIAGVTVFSVIRGGAEPAMAQTGMAGAFAITTLRVGAYSVWAEKAESGKSGVAPIWLSPGEPTRIDLILNGPGSGKASPSEEAPSRGNFEFQDEPPFTVAGLADWTNAGGHRSDVRLRASETLTKETRTLEQQRPGETPTAVPRAAAAGHELATEKALREGVRRAPRSFDTNCQLSVFYLHAQRLGKAIPFPKQGYQFRPDDYSNAYDLALAYNGAGEFKQAREQVQKMLAKQDKAELPRLLGDICERTGDPLEAVRQYEQAVRLDPSEQNYFASGAELTFHWAIEPAVQVFRHGSRSHPKSARLQMGLGVALYARGFIEQAARCLGEASGLNTAAPDPYLFLGQMESAAPATMPGVEEKLARFLSLESDNARANYYHAISLWTRQRVSDGPATAPRVESLLDRTVELDPNLRPGYLQLVILYFDRQKYLDAVRALQKAIDVGPHLEEAHYRLAQAYTRAGEDSKARQDFQEYELVEKQETAQTENERREIRQFVIVLRGQPSSSKP